MLNLDASLTDIEKDTGLCLKLRECIIALEINEL
jgi:hypothetical protein